MVSIYYEIFILLIILTTGIYCVVSNKLSTAIISLAIVSLLAAFFYLLIGAPDVALTEASVGSAVSTCIILAALTKYHHRINEDIITIKKFTPFLCCILLFIFLCYFTLDLPLYGDLNSVANQGVALKYKQNILKDMNIESLVTGILANYRGFDTLGETFVILTSGIAVTLILKNKNEQ